MQEAGGRGGKSSTGHTSQTELGAADDGLDSLGACWSAQTRHSISPPHAALTIQYTPKRTMMTSASRSSSWWRELAASAAALAAAPFRLTTALSRFRLLEIRPKPEFREPDCLEDWLTLLASEDGCLPAGAAAAGLTDGEWLQALPMVRLSERSCGTCERLRVRSEDGVLGRPLDPPATSPCLVGMIGPWWWCEPQPSPPSRSADRHLALPSRLPPAAPSPRRPPPPHPCL